MFEVIHGGLMVTVQDLGRPGLFSLGIPTSGAMDSFSVKCGNTLLNNALREAALEILLYGLKLRTLSDLQIAITGAETRPIINGEGVPMWEAITLAKNDIIEFPRFPEHGARVYLCVKGGIQVPEVFGSKSTFLEGKFGGFQGRALEKGDIIQVGTQGTDLSLLEKRKLHKDIIPKYSARGETRVILGPQDYLYNKESIEAFLHYTWKVSPKANRVGLRYEEGPELTFKPRSEREIINAGGHISAVCPAGNPLGAIQVPLGKEIVVLAKDGPTRGGYSKIATVIHADLDKVGQLRPGDETTFRAVGIDEAYEISHKKESLFEDSDIFL
ncbi:MAG: biotin-dependent carboxyltransferase family protein [Pseudomonadota bacterium]